MKKLVLLIFILTAYMGYTQCVDPVITDFECSEPSHPFGGNGVVTIPNSFSTGINPSANIGQFTDDGTAQFDNLLVTYGTPIDLSVNSVLHIKVYTELTTPKPLVAKLEGGTAIEIEAIIDVSNEWKEYTFDFASAVASGNTTLVLFFNAFLTDGTATDLYYIDDLFFAPPSDPQTTCTYPILTDFECDLPSQPISGALANIENPVSGGINTSLNIGEYTDNGQEGFDALIIDYGSEIDLSVNSIFKLKFYSPSSVQILAKLEGGIEQEIFSDFSEVNAWQELTFDFSGSAGNGNTKLVLFFNPNVTTGTPTDIYYIDDLLFDSSLSIDNVNLDNTVSLYPNPTEDIINISSLEKINGYQIFDLLGKRVVSNYSNIISNEISVRALKSGIYFIKLETPISNAVVKFIKK